ncbi:MAG: hypothetical protein M3H12_00360 [Chromatiales bacterium]|nr:hypothetical protein [Gammaproteobacteria bacterium]
MAVSKTRKIEIQQEIAEWIETRGTNLEVEKFRARFPEVSRATFYRWVKTARISAAHKEASNTVNVAQELKNETANAVRTALPIVVTPETVSPIADSNVISIIHECINSAKEAVAHCRTDGRILNFKGFLQANRALLSSIETLTKVSERLMDMQKIEELHAAVFEEIRKADPTTARRILGVCKVCRRNGGCCS